MVATESKYEPRIRIAKMDSICIYPITEGELSALEEGSPGSIYLNFSIFLLSVAISLLMSLFLTKIESDRVFTVFVVLTTVGFVAGFVLLVLWIKAYRSATPVARKIRERGKEEANSINAIQENTDPNSTIGASLSPSLSKGLTEVKPKI